MATVFDSTPTSPRPVNQPLIYTLSDSAYSAGDRFIVKIAIQGVEQYKVYLQPNDQSKAHFDASKILKDLVSYDFLNHDNELTVDSTDYTNFGTGAKTFTITPGLYNGSSEAYGTPHTLNVTKGAQQASNGLNPSWAQYVLASGSQVKGWMTELPLDSSNIVQHKFHPDDLTYHGFLANDNLANKATFTRVTDSGPSTVTKVMTGGSGGEGDMSNGRVNYIPTSYAALVKAGVFTQAQVNAANYISIFIATSFGVALSREFRSTPDSSLLSCDAVQLAYGNKHGAIDYLRFEGKPAIKTTARQKTFLKPLGNWNAATYDFSQYDWQEEVMYREAEQAYELVGRDFSDTDYERIVSAIKSSKVMIRIGTGAWKPVVVDTNSFTYRTKLTGRQEVKFNVKLAQQLLC